jgi:hypothetical protein
MCARTEQSSLELFAWNASIPGDARIDFDIAVAPAVADLAAAPVDSLQFSDPPGPAALAGQSVSARSGTPDTQTGGTVVDWTLQANGRLRTCKAMRLRAHLFASPELTALQSPSFGTSRYRQPAE